MGTGQHMSCFAYLFLTFMLTLECTKEILSWGGYVKVVFSAKPLLSLQTHT